MPYRLLPGRVATIATTTARGPIVVAVLCVAASVAAWYSLNRSPELTSTTAAPAEMRAPDVQGPIRPSADWAFHVGNLKMQLESAGEHLARAQRVAGSLGPDLAREGLYRERRRAEAAVAACESAKQALERAVAELEVAIPHKE